GHGQEGDNWLYAFDVDTLTWEALDGSDPITIDVVYQDDGKPSAYHTYNTLAHIYDEANNFDHFYGFGMPGIYDRSLSAPYTNAFDMRTKTWSQKADSLVGVEAACDVRWSDSMVFCIAFQARAGLHSYNPITDVWAEHNAGGWEDLGKNGVIDQANNWFVETGDSEGTKIYDLSNPGTPIQLQTSGDTEIEATSNPGMTYDSLRQQVIAWTGGLDVYVLDVNEQDWTATWTKYTGVGTDPGFYRSIHGNFRYVEDYDAYVLFDDPSKGVFIWKPNLGAACTEGATEICGSGVGMCQTGVRTCTDGQWGVCEGEIRPTYEKNNGADDDCDNQVDEDDLLNGLIFYSPLESVNPADQSSNQQTITANGPTAIAGQFGNALHFDGVDDYLSLPEQLTNTQGSISLWTKADFPEKEGCKTYPLLYQHQTSNLVQTGYNGCQSIDAYGLEIRFGHGDINTIRNYDYYNDDESIYPRLPKWTHLVFTWDVNGEMKVYTNGVINQFRSVATGTPSGATEQIFIGADNALTGFWFGSIDDVAMWNRVLDEQEIKDLHDYELSSLLFN
ncbi:LamG domain-containing protein, partial [Candidatus Woesearchaeota archaeon]|nr:LamG domain-containing protein [Candidatus Woesearchaeota archaeon]